MKLYEVIMESTNPSAGKRGYFSSLEKAEAEVEKWREYVKDEEGDEEGYWGKVTFEIIDKTYDLDSGID